MMLDEKSGEVMRGRSFSFFKPAIGGIYSKPDGEGAWDLEDSLGFRSIVSISKDSEYIYALERGSRTVGIWRKRR
jgi:hypothetical protein